MRTRGGARSVLGLGVVLMVAAVLGSCSGGDAPPAPTRTHAQPSLSGCPTGATCTTTSVPIVADTELWSNSPDGAYGGYGLILSRTYDFATGAPFYRDHTLLRFETGAVASAIGASRELVRAVIRLHGSPNVSPPDGAIAVRRLLSPWDEATATWNNARTTPNPVPWVMSPDDAAGVTWESTGSAADLHDVNGSGTWDVDVTHEVEAFLGGEANHGVIVYRALDVALPDTFFHSREDADPDLRPSLILTLADAATANGPPPIQSDFGGSVSGIWSGANAIQQGFTPTDAAWHRIGVVRGVVTYLQTPTKSNPFPGVTVSVVGHPEFGSATTRSDGSYELGVYGGGPVTLRFVYAGYNELQRTVNVPWQDWRVAPTVVMTPEPSVAMLPPAGDGKIYDDSTVWQMRMSGASPRRFALLVPPGTRVRRPDGSFVGSWQAGHLEYTVDGPFGPLQMPGTLPPTSAYTYADEWTVNPSTTMGAIHDTTFTNSAGDPSTVSIYVEAVVDIPAGQDVPTGYYDRALGHWAPQPNGRVLHILGPGGTDSLDIDVNGDGIFNGTDQSLYTTIGLTEPEVVALRAAYGTGARKVWRVQLAHFSPFDLNWAIGVLGGLWPKLDNTTEAPDSCASTVGGSIVGCETQNLGERLDLAGTPFALHYNTNRVPGRRTAYTVRIPLIDARLEPPPPATPPERPDRVHIEIQVAGQHFHREVPYAEAERTRVFEWEWDGRDARGTVVGPTVAQVRLGYLYPPRAYASPVSAGEAFGGTPGIGGMIVALMRESVELAVERGDPIGTFDARLDGLGGWTLDAMHRYSPATRMLYMGDGTVRRADRIGSTAAHLAGNGTGDCTAIPNHSPALGVSLCDVRDVVVAPGGEAYVAYRDRVAVVYRHRLSDGRFEQRVHHVVSYNGVSALAYDAAGANLYMANGTDHRIARLRLGTLGTIDNSTDFSTLTLQIVAGNGSVPPTGVAGDEHLDATALPVAPQGLAVSRDGTVFFTQGGALTGVVRRLVPGTVASVTGGVTSLLGGRITTLVGGGTATCNSSAACGDGNVGRLATLGNPTSITAAEDGSLYVSDTIALRVRRVRPDGVVETALQSSDFGASIGGGIPKGLTMDAEGALIAAFESNAGMGAGAHSIVRLRPDGRVVKVHGQSGGCGGADCEETGLATESRLGAPGGISLSPSGELYVVDTNNLRLKVIAPALPRFASRLGGAFEPFAIPSQDGALLYFFDAAGRHESTVRTATGEAIYHFEYTSAGHLHRVEHVALGRDPTSGGPRYTTIQRDAGTGRAISITGPFGQVTQLDVDDRGWLAELNDPLMHAHAFTYAGTGGLLSSLTTPRTGATYHFAYDALGRLTRDTDPNGRDLRLALTRSVLDRTVDVTVPSGSGARHGRFYEVTPNASGGEARRSSPRSEFGLIDFGLGVTTVYGPAAADTALPLRTEALRAGEVWSIAPDGTATRTTSGTETGATAATPSERFAAQASFVGRVEVHTPRPSWDPPTTGASAYYQTAVTRQRQVIMPPGSALGVTDPGQRIVDTVTIGGRVVTVEDRRLTESPLVRRVKTSAPGGRHAWLDYDAQGRVLSECDFGAVDAMGVETCSVALRTYQYFPTTSPDAGLLDRVMQGDRIVRYGYTNGRVTSVTTGPEGDTRTATTHHDAAGRVDWVDLPGATSGTTHRTEFGYDPDDVLSAVTTPRTHAHAMGADLLGQPTSYTPPAVSGSSTSTTRSWRVDRALDLHTLPSANDPGGPTGPGNYRASYDHLGRTSGFVPAGMTPPAGASAVTYDTAGRVETVVNVLGGGGDVTVTYGHGGAIPAREQQSFAAASATWSGVVQHAFDDELRPARTRIEAVTGAIATDLTRQWGGDGLQERTTLAGSNAVVFSRVGDVAGRVRSMDAGLGAQYTTTTFTYDDTTEVALQHRYGGLIAESTSRGADLLFRYDATAPASESPRRVWDAHGRITHMTESIRLGTAGVRTVEHVYTYDYAGRLESETRTTTDPGMSPVGVTETYSYDANGNRLTGPGQTSSAGVTHDAQDRLTGSYAGITHSWTPRGAVNTRSFSGLTITYRYDVFGALQSVTQTGRSEVTYVNDALGRRLAKLVGGVMKRRYVYDGSQLVAEVLHDASQALRVYIYGSRVNVPDVMVTGNLPYRVLSDHRGSVRSVVRLSDGVVMQRMEYDAWGAVTERYVAEGFTPVPFGFAGGLYDTDTGFMSATGPVLVADREAALVRFGARDYDAVTGRWMAKEPLGFGGGEPGLYTYCHNDPLQYVDTDGLNPLVVHLILMTAGGLEAGAMSYAEQAVANLGTDCGINGTAVLRAALVAGIGGIIAKAGIGAAIRALRGSIGGGGVYLLRDPASNKVMRTGRTNNLAIRERQHLRDPSTAHLKFEAVYPTNSHVERRGLEQLLHEQYNPPMNYVRPLRDGHPLTDFYMRAARDYLTNNP